MALLTVGDAAPEFTITAHTGERVSLSDQRGRTVVLWWYPKADTPGCTIEGQGFRDLATEFASKGVRLLGISCDSVEENRAFAEKHGFPFPLLCDVDREVSLAYGTVSERDAIPTRVTYVIAPDGRIAEVHDAVDPKVHPQELLDSL